MSKKVLMTNMYRLELCHENGVEKVRSKLESPLWWRHFAHEFASLIQLKIKQKILFHPWYNLNLYFFIKLTLLYGERNKKKKNIWKSRPKISIYRSTWAQEIKKTMFRIETVSHTLRQTGEEGPMSPNPRSSPTERGGAMIPGGFVSRQKRLVFVPVRTRFYEITKLRNRDIWQRFHSRMRHRTKVLTAGLYQKAWDRSSLRSSVWTLTTLGH